MPSPEISLKRTTSCHVFGPSSITSSDGNGERGWGARCSSERRETEKGWSRDLLPCLCSCSQPLQVLSTSTLPIRHRRPASLPMELVAYTRPGPAVGHLSAEHCTPSFSLALAWCMIHGTRWPSSTLLGPSRFRPRRLAIITFSFPFVAESRLEHGSPTISSESPTVTLAMKTPRPLIGLFLTSTPSHPARYMRQAVCASGVPTAS
ncbi:hypothetical protein BJ912DRAFT_971364 [Pholiota molesta]|nr:hypothetical protein BJ912DRAFT_971364 [Pholiota molesta]